MRNGNLSNQLAPAVGVRFETVIYNHGKVNQPGKALCEALLSQDCNLYLISLLPERKVRSWCYKYGVGYTRVLQADSLLEIPELSFHNHLIAYYDVDDRILADVSMRGSQQCRGIKWEQPLGSSESTTN